MKTRINHALQQRVQPRNWRPYGGAGDSRQQPAHKPGAKFVSYALIALGVLCLAIHLGIYCETQASAFINQPEFYYNRFAIRDVHGASVKEVSLAVGYLSYLTAGLGLVLPLWGAMWLLWNRKKRAPA